MPSAPLVVAIAIIESQGRFLISQRKPEDSFGGHWEFPGGKLEPGESLEEALVREIKEELGILIRVGPLFKKVEHEFSGRAIHLHCFLAQVLEGTPLAIECAAWKWVAAGELGRYPFPPASGSIIEDLQKGSIHV